MTDHGAAELSLLVSREHAENTFAKALGLYVGRGRRFSVEQLAEAIGCKPKAIYDFKSYPSGHPDHRPLHMGLQFSITAFLGSTFTNEWLKLCHQGAFDLPDEQPNPGDLAADNSDDNAKVVRAAIDGDLMNDLPILHEVGARMMSRGATLVALGAAA